MQQAERMRWWGLAFLLAGVWAGATVAAEPALQPFTATYSVEWKGLAAGLSTFRLERNDPDVWTYRSSNVARGLFRLAFPDAITQTSTFRLEGSTVVPLSFRADDGSRHTDRDVSLTFDWAHDRVTGTAEQQPVDAAIEPGTQDSMSVQISLMLALAAGRDPQRFLIVDKSQVKDYLYTRESTVRLDTALGPLETVLFSSRRPGSDRVTRTWLAPGLGYVPVRAERVRDGRIEWQMKIRKLTFSAA